MRRLSLASLALASLIACGGDSFTSSPAGQGGTPNAQAGASGAAGAQAGSSGASGQGGAAGQAGSAGTAGVAGQAGAAGEPACKTDKDCAPPDNECKKAATCDGGSCVYAIALEGEVYSVQTAGDCMKVVCDGKGGIKKILDEEDPANDSNPCTEDVCQQDGSTKHVAVPPGTDCGAPKTCDEVGQCVGCAAPEDCPGADSECQVRTCEQNVCGFIYTPKGTPIGDQIAGDCLTRVCGSSGIATDIVDDSDVPSSSNPCVTMQCANGAPQPIPDVGAACEGDRFCNAQGMCVPCIKDSQCPADPDQPCQEPTCDGQNSCTLTKRPDGPAPDPDPSDCSQLQCNGGVASKVAAAPGTPCGLEMGKVCSDKGDCGCPPGTYLVPEAPGSSTLACRAFGGALLESANGCESTNPLAPPGNPCACPPGGNEFSFEIAPSVEKRTLTLCLPPTAGPEMGGAFVTAAGQCVSSAYGDCTCGKGTTSAPVPIVLADGKYGMLNLCMDQTPPVVVSSSSKTLVGLALPSGCDTEEKCTSSQGPDCFACMNTPQTMNIRVKDCTQVNGGGELTFCYK